ncbi:hypothetical protein B0G84_7758 [Paraburkholderia sp. BL8N3]|nr:hypothetical protein B0G84_7758 [Paraburkholderia sp. BL8N3]
MHGVDFDAVKRQLTIAEDFVAGSRFSYAQVAGEYRMRYTRIKRPRGLNFFQHECYPEVWVPRMRLPDGSVPLEERDSVGQLDGFPLVFEAMVQMPFVAVARMFNVS